MTQQLVQGTPAGPLAAFADRLPPMIASADDRTAWRFVDFFAVTIRNPNTREAYYRAVSRFMDWCEQRGLTQARRHQAHPRRGLRRAAPPLTTLRQAAPLGNQQVLRLDGLRRHPRYQPGHVGPEAEARRQGRQDPGPQRRPGQDAARVDLNR